MTENPSIHGPDQTQPAVGFGHNAGGAFSQEDYRHPAAAWGAALSVSKVLLKQHEILNGAQAVFKMNHENGGYDAGGCQTEKGVVERVTRESRLSTEFRAFPR